MSHVRINRMMGGSYSRGLVALAALGWGANTFAQSRSEAPNMRPPPEHRPISFPGPIPVVSPGSPAMPPSTGGTTPPILTMPQFVPMEFKPWNYVPTPVTRPDRPGGGSGGHGGGDGHGGGEGHGGNGGGSGHGLPQPGDPDYINKLRERLRFLALRNRQWYISPWGYLIYSDGSYWYPGNSWWYDQYGYRPTIEGVVSSYDQTLAGQEAKARVAAEREVRGPANDRERAEWALRAGDAKGAVEYAKRHLTVERDDAEATRILAVALVASGNASDASAVVRRAYTMDPTLASRPIERAILAGTAASSSELVQRAVREAQRNRSASAWLLAAALTQGEGRDSVALSMLEKARKEGLDSKIADRLSEALEARVAIAPIEGRKK